MENAIKYYYNIEPVETNILDNGLLFKYDEEIYYMYYLYNLDEKWLKSVYDTNKKMIDNNILVHEIILNKFKQLLTFIDDKYYVLMRVNVNLDKKIDLSDVSYFQYISGFLIEKKSSINKNWGEKWARKIDYYEQQAIEIGKKYPIALECFNYFIGISENAIMYLNELEGIPDVAYCHIRPITSALEFYNPFNLIVDYKIRDVSEYIKIKFIDDKFNFKELNEYILNNKLSNVDIKYMYARMLFPTYFFDVFEKVMESSVDEVKIACIVKKIPKYESLLLNMNTYLNKYSTLEKIDWIKKSN